MGKVETFPWDAADYLETKEHLVWFIEAVLDEDDDSPTCYRAVLRDIAQAMGGGDEAAARRAKGAAFASLPATCQG